MGTLEFLYVEVREQLVGASSLHPSSGLPLPVISHALINFWSECLTHLCEQISAISKSLPDLVPLSSAQYCRWKKQTGTFGCWSILSVRSMVCSCGGRWGKLLSGGFRHLSPSGLSTSVPLMCVKRSTSGVDFTAAAWFNWVPICAD